MALTRADVPRVREAHLLPRGAAVVRFIDAVAPGRALPVVGSSPVPTDTMVGFEGATTIAPVDIMAAARSKIGAVAA